MPEFKSLKAKNKKHSRRLSHIDVREKPAMVDIGRKNITRRTAEAMAEVRVTREIADLFRGGDLQGAKGPVFSTAIIAGTQAVKDASRIIPFCHPIPLDKCSFEINLKGLIVSIRCRVSAEYKTGVEMEALTGVSVAALTVYDMCKAVSHNMRIQKIKLTGKSGGKRNFGNVS
jgi:cyclic pyranopterin phosphate synthase